MSNDGNDDTASSGGFWCASSMSFDVLAELFALGFMRTVLEVLSAFVCF